MSKKLFFILFVSFFLLATTVLAQEDELQALLKETPPAPVSKTTSPNKISLDIKGMDIVDVLKMLATRAGLNIVLGKNVTGRVTLFLKDVDILDAFEIIILANDLAFEQKADIINVMTQRDYELLYGGRFQDKKKAKIIQLKYAKAIDLSRALSQIKSNLGKIVVDEGSNTVVLIDTPEKLIEMEALTTNMDVPVQTKVFSLSYAQAEKISQKLQDNLTKGIGYLRIDERTNKIAVTDYPRKLDEIGKLIKAFDEKTPQVLIDAQIIQINPSDLFEMGVDWDYWIKRYFEVKAALPVGTANRLFLGTTSTAPSKVGDYKAILDILRTIGDVKILSSPRIMAVNNQEAKIHVGTKDAYITSTTSQSGSGTTVTSQTVNFVDTGIQLRVTPTINPDGFVTMKIKPEISDSTRTNITSQGQITQIPIVSTSEAETTVMVKDGVTIIIGGLRKDKREKTVKKIPLLGDIPFFGFFFRSTSDNLTKTDLVILLTPHILSGETSFSDFAQIQPQDGSRAKMEKGNIVLEKIKQTKPQDSATKTTTQYYLSISERLKELALFNQPKEEKGGVKVSFTLNSNGRLIDEPKIIASNNHNLDNPAINCVKIASPFPSFPKELEKDEETFSITLVYK